MRTIGVVTTSRADYGLYRPILNRIKAEEDLELMLFVSGSHLSQEFGSTEKFIRRDGFEITHRVEMLLSSDSPRGIAKSMGLGTIGFAQAFAQSPPDLLLVLGDRFEMFAAVVAALPYKIPIAHIHGGELTEGAIDDAIRHSITKMSHLHFVATETYAQRVIQMGEEPWRVFVSGAPGLDNISDIQLFSQTEIEEKYDLRIRDPLFLITFHPVTLKYKKTEDYIQELLSALTDLEGTLIFTYPNVDTAGRVIIDQIKVFVTERPHSYLRTSLGTRGYFSVMSHAAAMIGNSSSGIVEAASFDLPVVNIGIRQKGRIRGKNIIDVGNTKEEILRGIELALSEEFVQKLKGMENIFGDGNAAKVIVQRLKDTKINDTLLIKQFIDYQRDSSK